jgi:predicted transcriptional regulator
MIVTEKKIIFVYKRPPKTKNVNDSLKWLGESMGLFSLRDKDQSCFRIFIELIKTIKNQGGISSDELAYKLNLTRGTVIHHINRLINAGIVISDRNRYSLRVDNLHSLIEEIEKDVNGTIKELKCVADDLDKYLGL